MPWARVWRSIMYLSSAQQDSLFPWLHILVWTFLLPYPFHWAIQPQLYQSTPAGFPSFPRPPPHLVPGATHGRYAFFLLRIISVLLPIRRNYTSHPFHVLLHGIRTDHNVLCCMSYLCLMYFGVAHMCHGMLQRQSCIYWKLCYPFGQHFYFCHFLPY